LSRLQTAGSKIGYRSPLAGDAQIMTAPRFNLLFPVTLPKIALFKKKCPHDDYHNFTYPD